MSSRIENLGDYNKVRIDLQNAGGELNVLYGKIGTTALRKRKELIKHEPELKEQFKEAVQSEAVDEESV